MLVSNCRTHILVYPSQAVDQVLRGIVRLIIVWMTLRRLDSMETIPVTINSAVPLESAVRATVVQMVPRTMKTLRVAFLLLLPKEMICNDIYRVERERSRARARV